MLGCGSAVLTALQAQHKSIDDVELLSRERMIKAFCKGENISDWWDVFWHNTSVLKAQSLVRRVRLENIYP